MRGMLLLCVLSWLAVGEIVSSVRSDDYPTIDWKLQPRVCVKVPSGRVPWIIHARNPNYGWDEHTHRANIALAVNRYRGHNQTISQEDIRKMGLQLEVEVTTALFRNETSKIHENDLALYIHALLATGKNPRNFYCTDLVEDLLHRVDSAILSHRTVHPFLVLALCNSHAVTLDHLQSIARYTEHDHAQPEDLDGRKTELKALALKAFACAANLSRNLDKFRDDMSNAEDCLRRRQNQMGDGSFGNVYTTSLAVQAMIASRTTKAWDKTKALEFLEGESKIQVHMIKAYYIEMALNARSVNFIKDLYRGPLTKCVAGPQKPSGHFVQYTVKNSDRPDFYFTLTIKVDTEVNFFEIMRIASGLSDHYSFSHTTNAQGLPMVHMVSGTPNDAEQNMFWRICRQNAVGTNRHVSTVDTFRESPQNLIPNKDEHIILWYRDRDCPAK